MAISPFESENAFQDLIERFPELLSNGELADGSARRWILVQREADVPDKEGGSARWAVDHLFLDQDGVPTLIEVKRATDTRARREVVAQMLDYASHGVNYWKSSDLAQAFETTCARLNRNALSTLATLLGDEPKIDTFWQNVQANLSSGRIRMIFVADLIGPELERIVSFLNEQMDPATVLALELRPFANGEDRILSPRLIGATPRASGRKNIVSFGSVEEWLASTSHSDIAGKFLGEMRALGGSAVMTGKAVAIEIGPTGLRASYVREGGRASIALYQLKKSSAFQSDSARAQLMSDFRARGFEASSGNLEGEPAFDLPKIDDAPKWAALTAFFSGVIKRLIDNRASDKLP